MDIYHLKNAELKAKHKKYKGRVVLRSDIVKDDSGSYAVFTKQGSSASQMTAAIVMDIISRLPGCAGQAADAVSAFFPSQNGGCSQIIENSKIGISRQLDSSTTSQMANIMVQYGRPSRSSWTKSVWSSFGRTVMGKAIWENPITARLGEGFQLWMLIRTPWKKGYSYLCMWMTSKWLERNETLIRRGKYSTKKLIWENQRLSLIMYTWRALKDNMKSAKMWTITEPCSNPESPPEQLKNYHARKICVSLCSPTIWKIMRRNLWERYCELANKTTQQLHTVSTPCIDDHHFEEEELKSVRDVWKVCSQFVLTCLYLPRIGRPDILWSVNKLARSITKWTRACDKRLNRLVSYIHHTCENKQYCCVGNTAKHCRLGLFQYSDFAGDLEDSKSTSGGTLCVLGKSYICSNKLECKKQTSVSHSSTESEIISLDAALRLSGTPALDFGDLIVAVLGNTTEPW